MTVTSATSRETTRAARTSDVFTTARPPSRVAGVVNSVSIVCRMLSRKTLGAGLIALVAAGCLGYAGYRVWRHYLAPAPTPAPAPKTAVVIGAPGDAPTGAPATAAPTPVPTLPPSVFIKVPYTSEFPHHDEFQNPNDPHLNYCEAAALE